MSRLDDALMDGLAYSGGHTQPMLDPTYGGQFGFAPDFSEWVSNQAYVRRHVIPILLEAPRFFQLMPNPDVWVRNLRALVERHPRSIEGLNKGLTVTTDETPVGGGGEMQEEVTDVKRARSQPVFAYHDKYGNVFQNFFHDWITYGLMDPDSKVATIGTLAAGQYPSDMLADMYSMTVIFIEPDPTHRKVVKAWLSTNMFPKMTGDMLGSRDLTNAMQLTDISIEFAAITQTGLGVDLFAQSILDGINITDANPYTMQPFISDYSPDVAREPSGYQAEIDKMAETSVTAGQQ